MRLIDADAMREEWLKYGANEYIYDANAMLYDIDEQPTIDAVPVVRCKDCKHCVDYRKDGNMWCMRPIYSDDYEETGEIYPLQVPVTDHCFCSYGERKEQDNI